MGVDVGGMAAQKPAERRELRSDFFFYRCDIVQGNHGQRQGVPLFVVAAAPRRTAAHFGREDLCRQRVYVHVQSDLSARRPESFRVAAQRISSILASLMN